MQERSFAPWVGLDDQQIVSEMLNDRASPHWGECRHFIRGYIDKHFPNLSIDLKEEAVQRTWVSVSEHLETFAYKGKFTGWLGRIAKNRAIDVIRERDRDKEWIIPPPKDPLGEAEQEAAMLKGSAPATIEHAYIKREELGEVITEIRAYIKRHGKSDRNSKIIQMVLFEDYSCEEVAERLNVPAATVSYVVRSIQSHLKKRRYALDSQNPPPPNSLL